MELKTNRYQNKLIAKFGKAFEVDIRENYQSNLPEIGLCTSVRIGVDLGNNYFPNEVFQVSNSDDKISERLDLLFEHKCANLWLRLNENA